MVNSFSFASLPEGPKFIEAIAGYWESGRHQGTDSAGRRHLRVEEEHGLEAGGSLAAHCDLNKIQGEYVWPHSACVSGLPLGESAAIIGT
jgi:hypothetical protein